MIRRLPRLMLAAVATLAACGDSITDEQAIRTIIVDGGRDPATICAHLSGSLLKSFGSIQKCRDRAAEGDENGPEVKIDRLRIDGDTASAAVTGADGTTRISFVKDDGAWKVSDTRKAPTGG